jgi:predicted DsbA family dithiol-disulfide isomerase
MRLTVTNYLDVISSWCHWAIPAWQELQTRYRDRVDFKWKIALMDREGLPTSREQIECMYRRSGILMRSEFMLL